MAKDDERPLEVLRWQKRAILVLAEAPSDAALVEQVRRLAAAAAELAERDVVIVEATRDGSRMVGLDSDAPTMERLRQVYAGGREGFQVLLIGKDGGVKLQAAEPVDVAELFALIDSMPMRRREMREPAARRQTPFTATLPGQTEP